MYFLIEHNGETFKMGAEPFNKLTAGEIGDPVKFTFTKTNRNIIKRNYSLIVNRIAEELISYDTNHVTKDTKINLLLLTHAFSDLS